LLILSLAGFALGAAKLAVTAGAALDIALGAAMLVRRTCRLALMTSLMISTGYLLAAAVVVPHLFADPLAKASTA
jgi:hypothetical protein